MERVTMPGFLIVVLIFLGFLMLAQGQQPFEITGYWQGTLQGDGTTVDLQLYLSETDSGVTGWIKLISDHSYSIIPITSGSLDLHSRTLTIQATSAKGSSAYSLRAVGKRSDFLSPWKLTGECIYTHAGQKEVLSLKAQKGASYAFLTGYWEGKLRGKDFDTDIQLDLSQSEDRLLGWVKIVGSDLTLFLTHSSGEVDQDNKLVTITAVGSGPLTKVESYNFSGTLELSDGRWVKAVGSCQYVSGDEHRDLVWSAVRKAP